MNLTEQKVSPSSPQSLAELFPAELAQDLDNLIRLRASLEATHARLEVRMDSSKSETETDESFSEQLAGCLGAILQDELAPLIRDLRWIKESLDLRVHAPAGA